MPTLFLLFLIYFINLIIGIDGEKDVLLQWNNITVTIKNKCILHINKGNIKRKHLLAVLGPSGSGKTTFLNSISGRLHNNDQHDVVASDTLKPINQNQVAFVYQEDSFFAMLTVYETITLAYHLHTLSWQNNNNNGGAYSNNHSSTSSTSTSAVQATLQSLALQHVSMSKVGDIQTRGISGGERKRLSLACELVGDPSLLIVDEPTSGLDSFQSQNVVSLLRELAHGRSIAVVITIHQPSSSIWAVLDDVMLLTPLGRVVYHGPRTLMLEYFAALGYICPSQTNPAEFLIDLVSIDNSSPQSREDSRNRISNLIIAYDTWQQREEERSRKQQQGKQQPLLSLLPGHTELSSIDSNNANIKKSIFRNVILNPIKRFGLLFSRALKQTTRDHATNIVRIGTSILLSFVVSLVHGKQGDKLDKESVADRINIIAQTAINIGMLSMMKTLQLFKKERSIIDRERCSKKYNAFEYLSAKFMAELPFDALTALSFGFVLHWRTHLHQPRMTFLGVCGLLGLVTSTLGMTIGALFPVGDSAMAIGPAVMVIYIIMGAIGPSGVGKPLPNAMKPLRGLSPMNHACRALCAAEFRHTELSSSGTGTGGSSKAFSLRNIFAIVGHVLKGVVGKLQGRKGILLGPPRGDQVLDSLGIGDATVQSSVITLLQLFAGHIAVSLLGLVFFRPK